MNISVFLSDKRNEREIHQMLQAENCTYNSISSGLFKGEDKSLGTTNFPWRVRLKDTLSKSERKG